MCMRQALQPSKESCLHSGQGRMKYYWFMDVFVGTPPKRMPLCIVQAQSEEQAVIDYLWRFEGHIQSGQKHLRIICHEEGDGFICRDEEQMYCVSCHRGRPGGVGAAFRCIPSCVTDKLEDRLFTNDGRYIVQEKTNTRPQITSHVLPLQKKITCRSLFNSIF